MITSRAKASFKPKCTKKGAHVSQFQEISDQLCEVLAYIHYKEHLEKQLVKEGRQPVP